MKAVLKFFGYGLLSIPFILATSFASFLIGGVILAFVFLSHSSPLTVVFTYPLTINGVQRQVSVTLNGGETDQNRLATDTAKQVTDTGRFQGSFQFLLGPADLKLFTTNISVLVPTDLIEGLVKDVVKEDATSVQSGQNAIGPALKALGNLDPSIFDSPDTQLESRLMQALGLKSRSDLYSLLGVRSTAELRQLLKQALAK